MVRYGSGGSQAMSCISKFRRPHQTEHKSAVMQLLNGNGYRSNARMRSRRRHKSH